MAFLSPKKSTENVLRAETAGSLNPQVTQKMHKVCVGMEAASSEYPALLV